MATVINCSSQSPEELKFQRIDRNAMIDLLACITISPSLNPVENSISPPDLINDPTISGNPVTLAEYMMQRMGNAGSSCVFHLPDASLFVCALQALMYMHLWNADRVVQILLIDDQITLPHTWSYRYPWRVLAHENDGISVAMVETYAQKFRTLCEVNF